MAAGTQVAGCDYKPFAWAATAALEWAGDPANGLVETLPGEGLQLAAGGARVAEWRGIGRLLAKCVLDGVEVRADLGDVFFAYLGSGNACASLDAAMTLLAPAYPSQHAEWETVLRQRLGGGTPALTTHSHAGWEEVAAEPVTDGNKRDAVRRWARQLLVGRRQEHLDAAHHAFATVRVPRPRRWRRHLPHRLPGNSPACSASLPCKPAFTC